MVFGPENVEGVALFICVGGVQGEIGPSAGLDHILVLFDHPLHGRPMLKGQHNGEKEIVTALTASTVSSQRRPSPSRLPRNDPFVSR